MKVKIVLFGHPNVGKSLIFNQLTGLSAIVSNYPGTTVEMYKGKLRIGDLDITVIDAPGTYSLIPASPAENVARKIVLEEKPDLIIHVVDATSLKRHLYLTLELMELGIPLILVVNQVDRADKLGIHVKREEIEKLLQIPVVLTVATEGRGIDELRDICVKMIKRGGKIKPLKYPNNICTALSRVEEAIIEQLPQKYRFFAKAIAIYLALGDEEFLKIVDLPSDLRMRLKDIGESIIKARVKILEHIYSHAVDEPVEKRVLLRRLDYLLVRPVTGISIMSVLTFAIIFSVLMIVHEISHRIPTYFYMNFYDPFIRSLVDRMFPEGLLHDILVGETAGIYTSLGLLTTGVFFVFFMILPSIIILYLVLGFLEDIGFLPRLIIPFDAPLKKVGSCGEAICPIIAGTGCSIVGVLGTRILKTSKSRFITSLLLVFGVPCMAQQVMIWRVLGDYGILYIVLLYIILLATLIVVGMILNKLIKEEAEELLFELPVWRKPQIRNVLKKTYVRVKRFIFTGAPIVLLGIVIVNLLYYTGVIEILANIFSPLISKWFKLPSETVAAIIIGTLRKDVAVGVLKATRKTLTPLQMLTAVTVINLYFPCIGSLLIIISEFGLKKTLLVIAIMFLATIFIGGLLGLISTLI